MRITALALAAALIGTGAGAEDALPAYLDDRSTPEAVVQSYFNALRRREVSRAVSYAARSAELPDFEVFREHVETERIGALRIGEAFAEKAAGSFLWQVPVTVEIRRGSETRVHAGCIFLAHVDPAMQDTPPYEPIGIRDVQLAPVDAGFDEVQGACPDGG